MPQSWEDRGSGRVVKVNSVAVATPVRPSRTVPEKQSGKRK
jgi:hypothetical protein